ncbi:MAG: hypothetical protein K6F52_05240 [Clostridia bacterium]|nr:hypothetical protein [Clostridia bacterium]
MSEVIKCKLPFRKLQLSEIIRWLQEKDAEGWTLTELRGSKAVFARDEIRHDYFFIKRKDYQDNKEIMESKHSMLAGWNCYLELVSVENGRGNDFADLQIVSLPSRIRTEEILMEIPLILFIVYFTYELCKKYKLTGNESIFFDLMPYGAVFFEMLYIVSLYMVIGLAILNRMPLFFGKVYKVMNQAFFVFLGIFIMLQAMLFAQKIM